MLFNTVKRLALQIPHVRTVRDMIKEYVKSKASDQPMSGTTGPAEQNPFWHYQASFDAVLTMQKYAKTDLLPTSGMLTNYLGVKIDPKFFPNILTTRSGTVEPMPNPNNWHADIAEWAAALRAVDLSTDKFVIVELGCGWGCWLNNTGTAARSIGRQVKLIGVEGDEDHAKFAHEALVTNGFQPHQFEIYHGIAGAEAGVALFPRQDVPGMQWGLEPILHVDPAADDVQQRLDVGSHYLLKILPLSEIVRRYGIVDLLHIDIQGGEADLLESCIDTLNESIRYIVVGTHSRLIEGRLETLFLQAGWQFEMDRPAISSLENGVPTLKVDGVQGWKNPQLT